MSPELKDALVAGCFVATYFMGRWSQRLDDETKKLHEDIKKLRRG